MKRQRVRIRFRKEGDLRWISHRDLARTWERAFRRAGLELAMSQGFHPKIKMSFPLALSLGVAATEEVVQFDLEEAIALDEIRARLTRELPHGLELVQLEELAQQAGKPQAERVVYEMLIPADRHDDLRSAIRELMQKPAVWIEHAVSKKPLDLLENLEVLELDNATLRIQQRVTPAARANPRDILTALGLADMEGRGYVLTRTKVELAPPAACKNAPSQQLATPHLPRVPDHHAHHHQGTKGKQESHEERNVDQRGAARGISDRDR